MQTNIIYFFSVPLKKRLVNNLADPDEFRVSNLEPALKNIDTVFYEAVYFSVRIVALLFKTV